ncbi:Ctr copper transporter [Aspergillus tamarii]|uniref:Copper transport protein n=1 Tax=Aspergillus tamarii TaxID=41984 RepID=A0A5N6VCE6_ASPTM|nr:Ctr copper transporter [Aspergillus tamarii]
MAMSAVFTTGTHITLFFSNWETSSIATYLLTLLLLFLLAWFNRFLSVLRFQLDTKARSTPSTPDLPVLEPVTVWRRRRFMDKDRLSPLPRGTEHDKPNPGSDPHCHVAPSSEEPDEAEQVGLVSRRSGNAWVPSEAWSWRRDGLRSFLEGLRAFVGYILMLAVMTFNVGVFCAVIAGIIIGELTLGRFAQGAPGWQDGACHA